MKEMKTEFTPGPWHYVVSHEGFLGQPENEMKEFFSIMPITALITPNPPTPEQ